MTDQGKAIISVHKRADVNVMPEIGYDVISSCALVPVIGCGVIIGNHPSVFYNTGWNYATHLQ